MALTDFSNLFFGTIFGADKTFFFYCGFVYCFYSFCGLFSENLLSRITGPPIPVSS
jgi:hypothetical protein